MTLKRRLLLSYLSIGLIPALLIGLLSLYNSSQALEQQAYNQLNSIRAIKQTQIESYFKEIKADLHILSQTLSDIADGNVTENIVNRLDYHHHLFESYINDKDFYDLFLIDLKGDVFYSVTKEADYQTNHY